MSRSWRWLIVILALIGLALALQAGLVAFAGYVLLGVYMLSRYLARSWITNVSAVRDFHSEPLEVGDSVEMVLKLTNHGKIPVGWVLVERFIPGVELTCGVLDGEPLAVTEIRPREGFYDYRAKYTAGFADHHVPAPVTPTLYARVMEQAQAAHRALGCRGVSRADFRYDPEEGEEQGLYLLEVNTQPGMTSLSLVPEQAAYRGIAFADLVVRLVETARCDR